MVIYTTDNTADRVMEDLIVGRDGDSRPDVSPDLVSLLRSQRCVTHQPRRVSSRPAGRHQKVDETGRVRVSRMESSAEVEVVVGSQTPLVELVREQERLLRSVREMGEPDIRVGYHETLRSTRTPQSPRTLHPRRRSDLGRPTPRAWPSWSASREMGNALGEDDRAGSK